jgi:uncharacterized phosphosugar-binding protein
MIDVYYRNVVSQLESLMAGEKDFLIKAAEEIDRRLRNGSILHLFGSGHSHLAAEDCLYRAGCFAPCNVILPQELMPENGAVAQTLTERRSGLAPGILQKYDVRKDDVLVIFSQSGINNVPVEMAKCARKAGVYVIGVGSKKHTQTAKTRVDDGTKLFENCDLFIDNRCIFGDAVVEYAKGLFCGPTSTIMGSFIIQGILCEVAGRMAKDGLEPPVYVSANLDQKNRNGVLVEKYRPRVRHL